MSQTLTFSPALSSSFSLARKLSRFVGVLFALGFLVMLSVAVSAIVFVFVPTTPSGVGFGIGFSQGFTAGFKGLDVWQRVGSMAGVELITVPTVLVLHHMRKLFFCFASGEVFATQPIAQIRWSGVWMTASFFTGIAGAFLLAASGQTQGIMSVVRFPYAIPALALRFDDGIFTGVPLLIAAYVMAEARRIAADHAEIV